MSTDDNELGQCRVAIVEAYKDYHPSIDAKGVVEKLVRHVQPEYLRGLKCIVLTNAAALPHDRRRTKSWRRRRKVRIAEALGLYHEARQTGPAWIEVFVDNLIDAWHPILLRISFFRDFAFSQVIYHEIGHHVHKVIRPEHREREDVADNWLNEFDKAYFWREYWYLLPILTAMGWTVDIGHRIAAILKKQ